MFVYRDFLDAGDMCATLILMIIDDFSAPSPLTPTSREQAPEDPEKAAAIAKLTIVAKAYSTVYDRRGAHKLNRQVSEILFRARQEAEKLLTAISPPNNAPENYEGSVNQTVSNAKLRLAPYLTDAEFKDAFGVEKPEK